MLKFIFILFISFWANISFAQNGSDTTDSYQVDVEEMPSTQLNPNKLTVPPDSVLDWKQRKEFAYASYLDSLLKNDITRNQPQQKQEERPMRGRNAQKVEYVPADNDKVSWLDNVFRSPITKWVLYSLAALFVLFVLYKLFFTGGIKKARRKAPVIAQPEAEEETLTYESDFDRFIRLALQAGNYRLAIRYQYLRVLHNLAERNIIEMAADKTNYQYVREMGTRGVPVTRQTQNDFAALTLNYEYAWYGEFNVDEPVYRRIEKDFNNFNRGF